MDDLVFVLGAVLVVLSLVIGLFWLATLPPPVDTPCPDCASTIRDRSHGRWPVFLQNQGGKTTTKGTTEARISQLHSLPPELVDMLMNLLSPLSLQCLKLTCRRFYYYARYTRDLSIPELFTLHCFLERDQPYLTRLICGLCRVLHDRSQFFPSELRKDPFHRRCMIFKPALRICPHFTSTFDVVRRLSRNCSGHFICSHQSCTLGGAPRLSHSWGNFYIHKRHYITMIHNDRWPDINEAKQLLDVYNVPICPHLSLADDLVLKAYRPYEEVFGDSCSYCDTSFEFRFNLCAYVETMPGRFCLDLVVRRNLGTLQTETDPKWLSQLSVTKEPDLTSYWLNCIILSQDYELDKRKRIRRNIPCGYSGCEFKAQIKDSENKLSAVNWEIRLQIESMTEQWLQGSFSSNHQDYATDLKDNILYKPLWAPPGTTWYELLHPYSLGKNVF
jgi:hypothetical protein